MNDATGAPLTVELRSDHIAVITLDRPHAINAIDSAMVRALRAAFRAVEEAPDIHVMVLCASGGRGFCAGVDLKERQRMTDAEALAFRTDEILPMFGELDRRTKPAIAAVFGHVLGGGLEMALCCDLIVAADDARFGLPEARWGMVPAASGCRKLPAVVGPALAREMILTSQSIDAQRALNAGLVSRVVPCNSEWGAAMELAALVASNVPSAVRAAKSCIDDAIGTPAVSAFDLAAVEAVYSSGDSRRGIEKFR